MEQTAAQYFWHNDRLLESTSFKGAFIEKGLTIYEVVRVMEGVPLFIEEHLQRLEKSAMRTGVNIRRSTIIIEAAIRKLIRVNQNLEGNIKLVMNYLSESAEDCEFLAYYIPHHYPSLKDYCEGVAVITYETERTNPQAKVASPEWRNKIDKAIIARGVYEALLVDQGGYMTEGSRSNLFFVYKGQFCTAPVQDVLPGITRTHVFALCRLLGIPVTERKVHMKELAAMEAMVITGTSPKILPVASVNCLKMASANHPLITTLIKGYDRDIGEYVKNRKDFSS